MSPAILQVATTVATKFGTTPEDLAACTEKLASLRYLIVLTARWAGSSSMGRERRKEMNRDLNRLRGEYSALIDHIAMTSGVQAAMNAQQHVERTVVVAKSIEPAEPRCVEEGYSI